MVLCFVAVHALAVDLGVYSVPVKQVMDEVVTRLYATFDAEGLRSLDEGKVLDFLTKKERHILANQYWGFTANVPVRVSVMRRDAQPLVPFWMKERGFKKTPLLVRNEEYTYQVWQKDFKAGRIGLGINGFDRHRSHYFVCVGPQRKRDRVLLSDFLPENQQIGVMKKGSTIYHDWDELVLTEVPVDLQGQILLPTIRGRSREAHLVGAFRETPYPSSEAPDQVMLTWSQDPKSTQTIQWRTSVTEARYEVQYRTKKEPSAASWSSVTSRTKPMEDRLLFNDRTVLRHTAVLTWLSPGTTYEYRVGCPGKDIWTPVWTFRTAPSENEPFSFIYMGDTHQSEMSGILAKTAFTKNPDAAFYTIAGDLVDTGLFRTDWDLLFHRHREVLPRKPLIPCLGNHDDQECLGAWMYLDLFSLPETGPLPGERERTCAFEYSNALIVSLDIASDLNAQAVWLKSALRKTDATWKFAMFHFPPYSLEMNEYEDIRQIWCPLFDQYGVNLVMTGHHHMYLRTKPIKNRQVVESPKDGTIYVISAGLDTREKPWGKPHFAEKIVTGRGFYQVIEVDGDELRYRAVDEAGEVRDAFTVKASK